MTLAVMVLGMLAAPVAAINGGVKGLWIVYFLIGLFAGPQHPAFNTMVSAWFPQRYAGTPAHAVNKTKQKCNPAVLDDNVITLTMKSKSRFFDSNLKPPPLPPYPILLQCMQRAAVGVVDLRGWACDGQLCSAVCGTADSVAVWMVRMDIQNTAQPAPIDIS